MAKSDRNVFIYRLVLPPSCIFAELRGVSAFRLRDPTMIYFDITNTRRAGHYSGLVRVVRRLLSALGEEARPVFWKNGRWEAGDVTQLADFTVAEWLLTGRTLFRGRQAGVWRASRTEIRVHGVVDFDDEGRTALRECPHAHHETCATDGGARRCSA